MKNTFKMIRHNERLDLKMRKRKEKISKFSKYQHTKTEGTAEIRYLRRELGVGNTCKNVLNIIINI